MKKLLSYLPAVAIAAAFILLAPQSKAQIHVTGSGDVGIGTTNPLGRLDIQNTSASTFRNIYNVNNYAGSSGKYGIYNLTNSQGTSIRYGMLNFTYGSSANSTSAYGLYNYAATYGSGGWGSYNYLYSNGGNGTKYGLYTRIFCGSGDGTGSRYALYSSAGCTGGYSGYFVGDVYIQGNMTITSDASKKTNVQTLTGALGLINQLQPKTYNYKFAENPGLPAEKQYGFIAQDLEQVLPELVKDVDAYKESDKETEDGMVQMPTPEGTIKTVNYIALIPILVEGMQEQQKMIDAQAEEIRILKEQLNKD